MKINWRRQHRWSSLAASFFLLTLCISGIMLNHRAALRDLELSRACLPPRYRFDSWNGGLLRGTFATDSGILIYGTNGIFRCIAPAAPIRGMTEPHGDVYCRDAFQSVRPGPCDGDIRDFNAGLPPAAGRRNVRAVARSRDTLYAATTEGLYCLRDGLWRPVALPMEDGETLSDLTVRGDTLIALGRSAVYISGVGRLQLPPPRGGAPRTTAFRLVWLLHCGQLFGTPGKLVADAVALVFVFLIVSGLSVFAMKKAKKKKCGLTLKLWLKTHRKIGAGTFAITAVVCLTGWCLRPPVMVPLALCRVPAASGTENPWRDRLRMIRYDRDMRQWLISTSEGFFATPSLDVPATRLKVQPPVSVMGLNVFEKQPDGQWLCGSFSGLYRWDVGKETVTDCLTGRPADLRPGPPFGKTAVSGYSHDFGPQIIVTYDNGTDRLPMPAHMSTLPMSAWNIALEAHTGRIFFGNGATWFYIFIVGAITFWALLTGYMLHRRRAPHRRCCRTMK